jgi:hypothetical protein
VQEVLKVLPITQYILNSHLLYQVLKSNKISWEWMREVKLRMIKDIFICTPLVSYKISWKSVPKNGGVAQVVEGQPSMRHQAQTPVPPTHPKKTPFPSLENLILVFTLSINLQMFLHLKIPSKVK